MKKRILTLCCFLITLNGPALAREVLINPITPDIRDRLRESVELISNVEDTMAPTVTELEKIYNTYTETCKGKEKDRGCLEIQKQVIEKYKEVLTAMEMKLPAIKKSVSTTALNLGKSIKTKTRGKDLKELYETVTKKRALPRFRGPLSKKILELLKAIGRPSTHVSILELSLQTQADLISADDVMAYLEAEISRQVVVIDLMQDFGEMSPEMVSVMKGVAELFGYDVDFGDTEMAPESKADDWRL